MAKAKQTRQLEMKKFWTHKSFLGLKFLGSIRKSECGTAKGRVQKKRKQAQLGVPHSRIQVELGFILQA